MAQKVGAPKILGTHRDDKLRQNASLIAGKARRSLFTRTGLTNGGTLVAAELLDYNLAASFFKSAGDAIHMKFFGQFDDTLGPSGLFITVRDENGATIIAPLQVTTAGGTGTFAVFGECVFCLDENKLARGSGWILLQDNVTPDYRRVFLPSVGSAVNAKKLNIHLTANASDANGVQINYFCVEYLPAAIR